MILSMVNLRKNLVLENNFRYIPSKMYPTLLLLWINPEMSTRKMILHQLTWIFLFDKTRFIELYFARDRTFMWLFSSLVIVLPIESWILPTHSRSSWYTGHHRILSLCTFKIIHYVNVEGARERIISVGNERVELIQDYHWGMTLESWLHHGLPFSNLGLLQLKHPLGSMGNWK